MDEFGHATSRHSRGGQHGFVATDSTCPTTRMSTANTRKRTLYPVYKEYEQTLAAELFFTDLNTTATCFICGQTVLYREFNMRRHYNAKHAEQYNQYEGEERKEVSEKLRAIFKWHNRTTAEADVKEGSNSDQNIPGALMCVKRYASPSSACV